MQSQNKGAKNIMSDNNSNNKSEHNNSNSPKSTRKDRIFKKRKKHSHRYSYSSYGSKNQTGTYGSNTKISTNRFSVVEAYKTLRTNLQFSMHKNVCNAIIITSTMPRDGKSTVASNVAVAFAQTDVNVLLIDCDMRKPRVNKFFNVPSVPGLSNVLAGLCSVKDAIKSTEYKNLSILTAGILPPNPAELLSGSDMAELVVGLKKEYDLIIMDTPPINIVSDAVVLTAITDGVVLVARHAVTSYADITKSIKALEFVNAKIIGLVLNAVDYSKIYGKRYGYYYNGGKYGYSKYGYGGYGRYGGYANNEPYGDNHNQPDLSTIKEGKVDLSDKSDKVDNAL